MTRSTAPDPSWRRRSSGPPLREVGHGLLQVDVVAGLEHRAGDLAVQRTRDADLDHVDVQVRGQEVVEVGEASRRSGKFAPAASSWSSDRSQRATTSASGLLA